MVIVRPFWFVCLFYFSVNCFNRVFLVCRSKILSGLSAYVGLDPGGRLSSILSDTKVLDIYHMQNI